MTSKQLAAHSSRLYTVLFGSYLIGIISLFLYSFTQVDLNLTLTRVSIWFGIQDFFQDIGYFQRPLSTYLFGGIIALLFTFYCLLFTLAKRNKLSKKNLWLLIGVSSGILLFSYPAFSYDIFNYMFDARIVTLYHENPYLHKALDYPADNWLLFMRWTHRTYPYGPLWLGLTVPLSFIGFQKFLLTLYLFKSLILAGYIFSVLAVKKILDCINPRYSLAGVALFALSPFVLVEGLVSAHNDIVMMALALWSFYFLIKKKLVWAIILLLSSIAIKFATVLLIPAYGYVLWKRFARRKVDWERTLYIGVVGMIGAIIAASLRTQFQPWYLLFVLPFAALLPGSRAVVASMVIMSITGLLQYVPFLHTGNWDPPVPTILDGILYGGIVVTVLVSLFFFRKQSISN